MILYIKWDIHDIDLHMAKRNAKCLFSSLVLEEIWLIF